MHGIAAYSNTTHYNSMTFAPGDAFHPTYTNGNARAFLDMFLGDVAALYLAYPRPATSDALKELWIQVMNSLPTTARIKMIENTYGIHFHKANFYLSSQGATRDRYRVAA